MATLNQSLNDKIIDCAKQEFLSKGYLNSSLREISKSAGVTTGAIYKRYSGKEALLSEVLKPLLSDLNALTEEMIASNNQLMTTHSLSKMWIHQEDKLIQLTKFVYARKDLFIILLCCTAGSIYEHFINDFVDRHTKSTVQFLKLAQNEGMVKEVIDEEELHMLLTAYWSTFFEPIIHNFSLDKALQHCKIMTRFFNWDIIIKFK